MEKVRTSAVRLKLKHCANGTRGRVTTRNMKTAAMLVSRRTYARPIGQQYDRPTTNIQVHWGTARQ